MGEDCDPVGVGEAFEETYPEGDELEELESVDVDEVVQEPGVMKSEVCLLALGYKAQWDLPYLLKKGYLIINDCKIFNLSLKERIPIF